jgi:putative hydrolase of the HAD superfamily
VPPAVPRPPAVVFLDAGDTLLAPAPSFADRFRLVAEAAGERFEPGAIEAALGAELAAADWSTAWTDPEVQRDFWTSFYRAAVGRLGPGGDPERLVDALWATFSDPATYRLFPDARPVLHELAGAGIRLGLISNFEPWLLDVLELEGVRDLFGPVAVSGLLGVAKPDPAIFHAALDAAGVEPAEAVHVGDSFEFDVEAAWAVGMAAVLIDRAGRASPPPHVTRLADLTGLPGLFHRGA